LIKAGRKPISGQRKIVQLKVLGVMVNIRMNVGRVVMAVSLAASAGVAVAQGTEKPAAPEPLGGRSAEDFLRLPAELIVAYSFMALAKVGPGDRVVDLGSGNERTAIAAVQHGAQGVALASSGEIANALRLRAELSGAIHRSRFFVLDPMDFDLKDTSVVVLPAAPSLNPSLVSKLFALPTGTRIVGRAPAMGAWSHDENIREDSNSGCGAQCDTYLWVVPAKVAGTWSLPYGELKLEQHFQRLSGTLKAIGMVLPVTGRLRGDQISLTMGEGVEFSGRVTPTELGGTLRINGVPRGWYAAFVGN
jgi:hypothetical protein